MRSIAAAQSWAQRGTVCLARCPASTASRALLLATSTSTVLRSASVATALHSGSSFSPLGAAHDSRRGFSQTAVRPKKGGGKKDKKGAAAAAPSSSSSSSSPKSSRREDASAADEDDGPGGGGSHPQPDAADPFDFADVESRWQRSEAHHEEKFKELRRALGGGGGVGDGEGAVDVDAIGQTPVALKGEGHGAAGHGQAHGQAHGHAHGHSHQSPTAAAAAASAVVAATTVPLSQLALIIPRSGGRVVELRMHSPASRKAIVSAVQADPLFRGQQPQPDPDDELVLLIKLGGAGEKAGSSAEAAAERARRVHDLANAWRAQIRRATERRKKAHQTWKKDKAVQPDDVHRLDRDLLKGQEKRMAKIDAAEKEVLRQLERVNRR